MTQVTPEKFLELVEKSGLIEKSQLSQSIIELGRATGDISAADTQKISSHLTQAGLLTNWQTKLLMEGKSNGFFLGKYKLLDHIGSGGMGAVFLAEHTLMHRRVAIKVMPRDRIKESSHLARFYLEARAVAALDHQNIIRAHDVDTDGRDHFLVMEYIDGKDVQSMVLQGGPLPFEKAAEIIRQGACGLQHAHERGLIHRDVKPSNLLVDQNGTVKLLDMGLARFADEGAVASLTIEHDERMLGTVDYLSPEQAVDSHTADCRTDIYSLGGTLYFALTGHPPFPKGTLAQRVVMHQNKQPEAITVARPDCPQELIDICAKMMAKSPAKRFQTAQEVADTMAEFITIFKKTGGTRPGLAARRVSWDENLTLAPLDEPVPLQPAKSLSDMAASSKLDTPSRSKIDPTSPGKLPGGSSTLGTPSKISGGSGSTSKVLPGAAGLSNRPSGDSKLAGNSGQARLTPSSASPPPSPQIAPKTPDVVRKPIEDEEDDGGEYTISGTEKQEPVPEAKAPSGSSSPAAAVSKTPASKFDTTEDSLFGELPESTNLGALEGQMGAANVGHPAGMPGGMSPGGMMSVMRGGTPENLENPSTWKTIGIGMAIGVVIGGVVLLLWILGNQPGP